MVVIWILLACAGLYLGVNLLFAAFSLRPFRVPLYISPGLMSYPQERVELSVEGLTLLGWWSPCPDAKGVVIATHGFVMNRCEWVPLLPVLHGEGWSCLFVDFRGQGASGKAFCTFGDRERQDVHAMINWVQERCPGLPIVLLGSSMGAAAAVYAAGERPGDVDGLILDGVYSDLETASKGWWVMVGGRKLDALLKLTLPLGSLMSGIRPRDLSVVRGLAPLQGKPILLAYGTEDPIVPRPAAQKVAEAAGEGAVLEWFEGAGHGHGRFREPARYHQAIVSLLRNVEMNAR
jgi:pimeloyl-ACP methyl ester carboxylesterase